jgi:integrase
VGRDVPAGVGQQVDVVGELGDCRLDAREDVKGLVVVPMATVWEKRLGKIVPFLLPHLTGRRAGTRRDDFRKAWATACKAAGVAGRTRHDLRCTAVRAMEQRGVPRSVAMKLTGHVYRRYAIVSPADLRAAAAKLADGPVSGPVHGRRPKTRSLTH